MHWIADTLKEYGALVGLLLNLGGAVVVTFSQSRITDVINTWLSALDFFVETYLNKSGPVVRFEGMDKQMEKALPTSRRVSLFGWVLICLGYALQIPGSLK